MWKVIFHFNRGKQVEIVGTKEEVQRHINITVFMNEDCVNYHCFKIIE